MKNSGKNIGNLRRGNPGNKGGGRPKGSTDEAKKEIKELAAQYREEALERLAYWMRSDNPKASVTAALALIERSDGKAPQAMTVQVSRSPEEIAAEERRYERLHKYLVEERNDRSA